MANCSYIEAIFQQAFQLYGLVYRLQNRFMYTEPLYFGIIIIAIMECVSNSIYVTRSGKNQDFANSIKLRFCYV